MKMTFICFQKNTLNRPIPCLQTIKSFFENVYHSVNFDDFSVGELNVTVNILKLHTDDIFFKKNARN